MTMTEINNTTAQHTPGPWNVYRWADGNMTCIDGGPDDTICIASISGDDPEKPWRRANADLIAAAPDLLAALEAVLRECVLVQKHYGDSSNAREAASARLTAEAAIAKARGL